MNPSYKILILSSSFGHGHVATARALQSTAEANPKLGLTIEIIDFSKEVNQLFDQTSKKIYEFNTKHIPAVYKWFYITSNYDHTPIRIVNLVNYPLRRSHLKQLLQQSSPDLIISNYPIWQYIAYQTSKKLYPDVEFATLITDSITVHSSWTIPDSDFYFVANQITSQSLQKLGVNSNKIFALGYPVHQTFANPKSEIDKIHLKYKVKPNQNIILFSASALRSKYVIRVANLISTNFPEAKLITVTGRDKELYKDIIDDEVWQNPNVELLSWTNEMPSLIISSQVVITKAGGSIVMECLAAKKPMIINKVIPGQEEGNAELVEKYNLGIIAKQPLAIIQALHNIFDHNKSYIAALSEHSQPEAAYSILKMLKMRLDSKSTN